MSATRLDLLRLYEALPLPEAGPQGVLTVSAARIPTSPAHRVAKDADGAPLLLVGVSRSPRRPPDVRLENLIVAHEVRCRVWHGDTVEEGDFTVVRCPSPDQEIRQYFLQVGTSFLFALGDHPSSAQVTQLVDALVQLFRALAAPARKSVQGLWAELFVMDQAASASTLARAWHVSPEERYDFSLGDQRLEVKSASGRQRRHGFSLEQLTPPPPAKVVVASVLMERAGGGTSLSQLVDRVRSHVASDVDLAFRIDAVVALTLGRGLAAALDERFDEDLARASLAFFGVNDIPRLKGEVPREVSDVHFLADLSSLAPVELATLQSSGGLFAAACLR